MASDPKKVSKKAVDGTVDGALAALVYVVALAATKAIIGDVPRHVDELLRNGIPPMCSMVVVAAKRAYLNWRKHK